MATRFLWVVALLLAASAAAKDVPTEYVVVRAVAGSPQAGGADGGSGLSARFVGVTAAFGAVLSSSTSSPAFAVSGLGAATTPEDACNALEPPATGFPLDVPWIAVVRRGNCSYLAKAKNAARAGASGVVVYNDVEGAMPRPGYDTSSAEDVREAAEVSLYMVGVVREDGMRIRDAWREGEVQLKLHRYVRSTYDVSVVVLFLIAVATVVAGAYWGSTKERAAAAAAAGGATGVAAAEGAAGAGGGESEVAYVSERAAYGFVVFASLGLIVLFFFVKVLIYVLIVLFALGGAQGLFALGQPLSRRLLPASWHVNRYEVRMCGVFSPADLALSLPCAAFATAWLVLRNDGSGWVMQNVLAVALLLLIQRTLRLPNVKVSAILLTLAFVYDIFWVFISPVIFGRSVMITVATGGDSGEAIPMLLKVPRFNDELGGYSLLGLGDVALPGLLVSYLMRFDCERRWSLSRGYFAVGAAGYAVGVAVTDAVLVATAHGQPALLYIVPCTLGVVVALAWRRGHLHDMWNGTKRTSDGLLPDHPDFAMEEASEYLGSEHDDGL